MFRQLSGGGGGDVSDWKGGVNNAVGAVVGMATEIVIVVVMTVEWWWWWLESLQEMIVVWRVVGMVGL